MNRSPRYATRRRRWLLIYGAGLLLCVAVLRQYMLGPQPFGASCSPAAISGTCISWCVGVSYASAYGHAPTNARMPVRDVDVRHANR
jgi:hypothetical protein